MRILMINVVCGIRSTGRICTDLATTLEVQGHKVKIAYGREEVPDEYKKYAVRIGSDLDVKVHALRSRIIDGCGWGSKKATEVFIKWVKNWNPDIIHLHNLHGYYINIEVLFNYLRTCGKKIIWTLHDCWAFTGHCTYFSYVGCDKWKKKCENCPQRLEYPTTNLISMAADNFRKKSSILQNVPNLQLITPSEWLKKIVEQSFMGRYPVSVIHNGIDINKFRRSDSDLRDKYGIGDNYLILGVAAIWNRRKGLDYLIRIAKETNYKVVVVGLNEEQTKYLPKEMICIKRTNSIDELAQWYSAANLFINPTLEDNYPTTNLEAIACGTPVITFNTGGSSESAEIYGITVNDYDGLKEKIDMIFSGQLKIELKPHDFSINRMVGEYIRIYSLAQ